MPFFRIRIATFFFISAIAGFLVLCVQARAIEQPYENLVIGWIAFCIGTFATLFLATLGSTVGGRIGSVVGAAVAILAWSVCLWILDLFEGGILSTAGGFHASLPFGVGVAVICLFLNAPKEAADGHALDDALDDHPVSNLLVTKRKLSKNRSEKRRN